MKKNLTKTRIIAYLMMMTASVFLVTAVTYSRFYSTAEGDAVAEIAASELGSIPIAIDVSGINPGATKTYQFKVVNAKDSQVSQVTQGYSISVKTTDNLPLTFTLSGGSSNPAGSGKLVNEGKIVMTGGSGTAEGGILPHTTETSHMYTLEVQWPKSETSTEYADEIDMITLQVEAYQSEPSVE
ncbi:hypothetical protein LQE92_11540 [Lacrimispora sp. NSJ-141]|uniref:Uncharacterized protein n=1 Tax=Lientehia hominis TaxID=2897778 RepID=A0AAP2RJP4_9FIRM|nr:hypothetical protein [Lientehia hominis]MCD2493252.1 hypothetical protein [Lientehia hominis]